jgi:hypothetical protein
MFFEDDDDDEYDDWNKQDLPNNCIRFGWHKLDGGLCKIEAKFDGLRDELNIYGMEEEMRNKAQTAIDAVLKGRMKCAATAPVKPRSMPTLSSVSIASPLTKPRPLACADVGAVIRNLAKLDVPNEA